MRNNGATANYEAGMVTLERRITGGLTFKGAYTFAKGLTHGGGREFSGYIARPQNPFNLSLEGGHSVDDVTHRFTFNYVYEPPSVEERPWPAGPKV